MARGMRSRKKQRFIILTTALVVLTAAVLLILKAFGGDSLSHYMQPTEAVAKNLPEGKRFRLGGLVQTGSFKRLEDGLTYSFVVTDCVTDLHVEYHGILPDLFREGQGVVTEGALAAEGLFKADTVLAKHDENYMPPGSAPKNEAACEHPDGGYDKAGYQ
ncbi:cytochrome c maturation protein CcmE [Kordiimonas pumila]|uniref:Cytochrome c-type biogenesis protein CcmE n=1 Tax=Kordiimonas pumila TaxID=2161677 RepID=A0ABV7D4B6_9PROT|nr:cytochrome c maturation protein CcmE [Kordiimonas pumila]